MSLYQDLQNRAPATSYTVWAAVNNGFLQSSLEETNKRWQRIQGRSLVNHYPIQLGAGGTGPTTHHGTAGQVEAREAADMAEWYAQQPGNVEAWILSVGEIVWRDAAGIIPPGDTSRYWNYVQDFLPNITPNNLRPIPDAPPTVGVALILAPAERADKARADFEQAAGRGKRLGVALTSRTNGSIDFYAGERFYNQRDRAKIERKFGIDPGDPLAVMLLDAEYRPLWSNDVGSIDNGAVFSLDRLAQEKNLKRIRDETP